jgi:hypothetical protein
VFSELSLNQAKTCVDAEQAYRACLDTQAKLRASRGGMHWKTIHGRQYLYRTLDSKGNAKSLGPRSESTAVIYAEFRQRRAELEQRLKSQRARLEEQTRMARALRVGSAPPLLAQVCRALCEHDLMGNKVLIIGSGAV